VVLALRSVLQLLAQAWIRPIPTPGNPMRLLHPTAPRPEASAPKVPPLGIPVLRRKGTANDVSTSRGILDGGCVVNTLDIHMSLSFVRAETRATECEPLEGVVLRLMQLQCFLCRLNKYANCIQNMRLALLSYRGELLAKFCVARTIIRRPFEHHQRHQHYHHQSHLHQHQYRGINDNSKYINTIINVTNIISNITFASVPNTTTLARNSLHTERMVRLMELLRNKSALQFGLTTVSRLTCC
jgi:hypothetical protein